MAFRDGLKLFVRPEKSVFALIDYPPCPAVDSSSRDPRTLADNAAAAAKPAKAFKHCLTLCDWKSVHNRCTGRRRAHTVRTRPFGDTCSTTRKGEVRRSRVRPAKGRWPGMRSGQR